MAPEPGGNNGQHENAHLAIQENPVEDANAVKRRKVSRKKDIELVCEQPSDVDTVARAVISLVNPPQQLEAIQQISNKKYVVSFFTEASAQLFHSNLAPKLRIPGTAASCKWLGVEHKKLRIAYLPNAVSNKELEAVLSMYGRIVRTTDEVLPDMPVVLKTGTRIVDIEMHKPVPNIITVCGYSVPVTYKGVKIQCRRCLQTGHLKADCKTQYCYRCKSFGHGEDTCSAPCLKCKAPDHHWKNCTVRSYSFAVGANNATTGEAAKPSEVVDQAELPVKSAVNKDNNTGTLDGTCQLPSSDVTSMHIEDGDSSSSDVDTDGEHVEDVEAGSGDTAATWTRAYKRKLRNSPNKDPKPKKQGGAK
jgi:hypothetical protein